MHVYMLQYAVLNAYMFLLQLLCNLVQTVLKTIYQLKIVNFYLVKYTVYVQIFEGRNFHCFRG